VKVRPGFGSVYRTARLPVQQLHQRAAVEKHKNLPAGQVAVGGLKHACLLLQVNSVGGASTKGRTDCSRESVRR